MRTLSRAGNARLGAMVVVACASVLALKLTSALAAPPEELPCRDGGDDCISIGFTDAWFEGETVQLEFSHRFFCDHQGGGFSLFAPQCEAGESAEMGPPSGPIVSEAYLIIPQGFSPPEDTLHCPVPGHCIDHPQRFDLSSVFGRRSHNAILPAHSIVIEDEEAFQSTWWPVVLVFVKNLDAWNAIVAAKSIEAVDECQENGGCLPEVETNAFLFFQVLGPGMSVEGPA